MENTPAEWVCDCPVECNTISYSFSIKESKQFSTGLCPSSQDAGDFLMKPFYDNEFPPPFVKGLMKIKNPFDQDQDVEDDCKANLGNRAEVIFKLATDTMAVTIMSRRLSFFDKMSAFGNYLLFSFLSPIN